jgi:hypothetical protein
MVGVYLKTFIMKNIIFKKLIDGIDNFNNLEFRLLKEKVEQRIYSKRVSYILETPLSELILAPN